jgi:hypothetical protein
VDNPAQRRRRQGQGGAATDEFPSLADAQAWLKALPQTIGSLSRAEFAEAILKSERAYEQFPELAIAFPRRALLRHLRAAAAALPEAEAIALLLLCAAAEPSDPASLAALFERAVRTDGGACMRLLLRLFRRYRKLGWEEIGPAAAALVERQAGAAAILEILCEIADGGGDPPEDAELGRLLAPLLAGPSATVDPAALLRTAAAARRRLAAAEADDTGAARRRQALALAERLRVRLRPPGRPTDRERFEWPRGEIGFPAFVAQWPQLAIAIPACQLYTGYAVLGADGILRAERHAGAAFCYGPYLNLPAGRYRVRIDGEAGIGAEYIVEVVRSLAGRGPAPVCNRRYAQPDGSAGVIAELAFTSTIALRNFEVVVRVTSPSAAFAIAGLTITADRLQADPAG